MIPSSFFDKVAGFRIPGRIVGSMPKVQGMTDQGDNTLQYNAVKTESGNVAGDVMTEPQGERPMA